jgi:HAE1 family hydrophobic/amphiphilic exporter-1
LSARVLHKGESRFYNATEGIFRFLDRMYEKTLKFVLRFKVITIVFVLILFVGSLSLFPKIGMDFIPKEDKAEFEVALKAGTGISLEEMIKKSKAIEALVKENKEVEFTTLSVGSNSVAEKNKATIYVKLVSKEHRKDDQEQIVQNLRDKLKKYQNKDMFITAAAIPNIKGAGVSVPYQIVLKSDSLEDLKVATKNLTDYLKAKKGFVDVDTNLDNGKPQIDINIIRENAARYGITAAQISEAISTAFSSDIEISNFEEKGKQYNITLRFDDAHRVAIEDLTKIQLRATNGELVYLSGLVRFKETSSQASIYHYDRQRQVSVYADLFGLDLGGAVGYTKAKIDTLLPAGVTYKFTGFAEEMVKTGKAFGAAIGLSVILMFIILAILYESLIQPIIIMMALPLSIVGVMLALFVSGQHFSLFVMIGFMLLMGMVGKNAVLLVDFANAAVENGKKVDDALIEAGEKRLRPILMTTIAMIFAMIPIAISTSLGSETKAPMAIAVIGGLLSSMFLTLLIVPVIYKLIYPFDRWLRKWYEKKKLEI